MPIYRKADESEEEWRSRTATALYAAADSVGLMLDHLRRREPLPDGLGDRTRALLAEITTSKAFDMADAVARLAAAEFLIRTQARGIDAGETVWFCPQMDAACDAVMDLL